VPDRPLFRQFVVLYVTLGLVVLIQSVETAVAAVRGTIPPADQHHALILGTLETIAAVLFLVPRTMRLGADLLLVIFGLAFVLHALRGDPPLTLLVYGAAALFVRTHGVGSRIAAVVA
jgi:hypothetical protein